MISSQEIQQETSSVESGKKERNCPRWDGSDMIVRFGSEISKFGDGGGGIKSRNVGKITTAPCQLDFSGRKIKRIINHEDKEIGGLSEKFKKHDI